MNERFPLAIEAITIAAPQIAKKMSEMEQHMSRISTDADRIQLLQAVPRSIATLVRGLSRSSLKTPETEQPRGSKPRVLKRDFEAPPRCPFGIVKASETKTRGSTSPDLKLDEAIQQLKLYQAWIFAQRQRLDQSHSSSPASIENPLMRNEIILLIVEELLTRFIDKARVR